MQTVKRENSIGLQRTLIDFDQKNLENRILPVQIRRVTSNQCKAAWSIKPEWTIKGTKKVETSKRDPLVYYQIEESHVSIVQVLCLMLYAPQLLNQVSHDHQEFWSS